MSQETSGSLDELVAEDLSCAGADAECSYVKTLKDTIRSSRSDMARRPPAQEHIVHVMYHHMPSYLCGTGYSVDTSTGYKMEVQKGDLVGTRWAWWVTSQPLRPHRGPHRAHRGPHRAHRPGEGYFVRMRTMVWYPYGIRGRVRWPSHYATKLTKAPDTWI